jgi:hypothetical protein
LINTLNDVKKNGKKIVALSLNRHIYDKTTPEYYESIVTSFVQFVKFLSTFGYHIVFLPFNTNDKVAQEVNVENDIIFHTEVYNQIRNCSNPTILNNITNINWTLNTQELFGLYSYFYATVPMRFHGCLFSIYNNVPMLPVFTTRKIKNLLLDIGWSYGYQLDTNEQDIPLSLDTNVLISRFTGLLDSVVHTSLIQKLHLVCRDLFANKLEVFQTLNNVISSPYAKISKENLKMSSVNDSKIHALFLKLQDFAMKNGYTDFRLISKTSLRQIVVNMASYYLTNSPNSIYNYGLESKMFNPLYNYVNEWKWIIQDYLNTTKTKLYNNPYGLFNINYIDQIDYSGAHRSGWQFVYDSIKYLHNENSNLYLDLYLDRTFHWNKEVNKILDLIPYKKDWTGFVHHTFDTSFSEYNNYNLLTSPEFLESLKCCKGIFVLSKTLQNKFIEELTKKNIFVPVYSITHPTEANNILQFTFKKFLQNKDKKLIHVGGWLRNVFSFYNLCIPSKYTFIDGQNCNSFVKINGYKFTDTIRKVALKGSNMDNYYPVTGFPQDLQSFLTIEQTSPGNCSHNASGNSSQNASGNSSQNASGNSSQNASGNSSQNASGNSSQNASGNSSQNAQELRNNWYKHYHEYTRHIYNSIDIVERLSNDEYDKILTENVVFVHLVDASAVNTVIECIVRNTPIIVNRLPAVVEMLGERYPLYYGDANGNTQNNYDLNNQVVDLLINTSNIQKAYLYLKNLDKSRFNITVFLQNFTSHLKLINTSIQESGRF